MAKHPEISFIGAGNVAWHLAPALDNAGYTVREVYSRHPKNAQILTGRLYEAVVKDNLDFSDSPSRIFIVSVADDAVEELMKEVVLPDGALLVHTSGSLSLGVLEPAAAASTGVFYPLQTFTKSKPVDFHAIPFCIESDHKEAANTLLQMARALSKKVVQIGSDDRKALHLAAVFACNFTNHMLRIAAELMRDKQLDFELLHPLIVETLQKTLDIGPQAAQTGPARRHDFEILDKHLELLAPHEDWAEIYRLVSQDIINLYPE
jgi:predicted short-subunit dehydrogenase-like oxidoreductase (DUF2520 family)